MRDVKPLDRSRKPSVKWTVVLSALKVHDAVFCFMDTMTLRTYFQMSTERKTWLAPTRSWSSYYVTYASTNMHT